VHDWTRLFDSERCSVSAHALLVGVPRDDDKTVVDNDDRRAFPIVAVSKHLNKVDRLLVRSLTREDGIEQP
jgi:hypothetical protein